MEDNFLNHEGVEITRNYSIDLLRILSMLMIVSLQSASHGGLNQYYELTSASGLILRFINIICSTSVNVFVIISAYFLSAQNFRLSKLIKILIQIVFYSWIILFSLIVFGRKLDINDLLIQIFPVSYKSWWFVTAYIGMYLLSPLLNRVLSNLTKIQHLFLIVCCLFFSSVLRDILPLSDPFDINNGYSFLSFVVLYIIASYIRHHLDYSKIRCPLLFFLLFISLMMMNWVLMKLLGQKIDLISNYGFEANWLKYITRCLMYLHQSCFF